MKNASAPLKNFLLSQQAAADSTLAFAECFTLTLESGTVLRYTDADIDLTYLGNVFSAKGALISGLKYRSTIGLNVDQQDITISAAPSVTVDGVSLMIAIAAGAFDGCGIQRDRVFYSDEIGGTIVDGVTLFKGWFIAIAEAGLLEAKITVADSLVVLQNSMPRNYFSVTCNHTLYDSGCGVNPALFATLATVGAGSTQRTLVTSAAQFLHAGGFVTFTSGLNSGTQATIKNARTGTDITLAYPLPRAVAVGDAFTIHLGCDHSEATCKNQFNNLVNFRGFPFVPPPQYAQ